MNHQKLLQLTLAALLIGLFLTACSAPTAAPAAADATSTLSPTPESTSPPPPTPQPAKPTPQPTGELRHEKITSQALAGNLVGDPNERGYFVYLPPGYADGNKRYPVVHILHGGMGNESQFLMLKDVYERMLQKGMVQEMILVFSDGNNKFRASNYLSSPTIGDYETYIARELVAQIDAKYRTIPHRDSRGITGCSMGGSGAMHLALNFPDVYNVVVPISASYDLANDPALPEDAVDFTDVPKDFNDLDHYWYVGVGNIAYYISLAAGAAPNPDKPPFYLDMPFEVVDGKGRIVPEVLEKIGAVDVVHDLEDYLQQPIRLRHIMMYHGASDHEAPIELARSFDQLLSTRNVEHEYIEFKSGHCDYSTDYKPVFQYLSDHLVAEQPAVSATPTATPTVTATVAMAKGVMPPGSTLNAVWGNSASDVFAVGWDGDCCELILHYDGSAWSTMSQGTTSWLSGVWSNSSSDVFAVGASGTILHYDGKAWSRMQSNTNKTLITVWGSSGSDVFTVGENGTILHYDGKTWSPMESGWPVKPMTYTYRQGLGTSVYLFVVWGSSGQDVFAVGDDGAILHYDGKAWSAMSSGTTNYLAPVWGSSGSDVFAGGDKGTILHYDGSAWSPMKSGTTTDLAGGIWGNSGRNVFVSGDEGLILHYDGTAWSPMTSGTTAYLQSMWGSSGSDVFAVGGFRSILHYDGSVWSDMSSGASAATPVAEAPTEPTPQPRVELIQEKITSQALAGNLLDDPTERTVYILLPPSYATSDKRYPVVYVLPWGDEEPGENASGFRWAMNPLLRQGEIEEMIVVVPDGSNKLGGSHFGSSPTIGDYETYATQEVVDYVDTHYRTLPTRDSRGLAGCSRGGTESIRLALKYPNVFSVVAATGGEYNYSLELWPSDVEEVQRLKELPQDISDLPQSGVDWYYQMAAGVAPDPDNPPFYSEMPVGIVNGRGEFVPEVIAKIVENDAMHEARRYVQQPVRLRGILIQHGLYDGGIPIETVHSFEQLLTDLGIEHEYVEEKTGHCGTGWEAASLKYMSDKLAFEGEQP